MTSPFDAQLITVQGELVEVSSRLNDTTWLMRDGERHIVAVLRYQPGSSSLPTIEPGSKVSVTGVFSVQVDDMRQPSLFRVLLRTPSDIVVVKAAP